LIAHFVNNEKQVVAQKDDKTAWFLFPSYWQSALIGLAGAIAFIFFIVAVGGLTTFSSLVEQIRIIAVCVIAGFGARSLLPLMVRHLEDQIAQAKRDAGQAKVEAKQASVRAQNATSEAVAAHAAADTATTGAETAMKEATEALRKAEEIRRETEKKIKETNITTRLLNASHPEAQEAVWKEALAHAKLAIKDGTTDPGIWINAARVQRWHGLIDDAIHTLTNAIAAFESETDEKRRRKIQCFAYYNRACYYASKYKEKKDGEYFSHALKDIELCLEKAEPPAEWVTSMRGDKELASIVVSAEFQEIVERFTPSRDD
jgi:hypothetical protein